MQGGGASPEMTAKERLKGMQGGGAAPASSPERTAKERMKALKSDL